MKSKDSEAYRYSSPVDTALYLASLTSEPARIDPILDTIRAITARPNFKKEALSASDSKQLNTVCDELIEYLTTQERVRKFTKEDLLERLQSRLGSQDKPQRWSFELIFICLAAATLGLLSLFVQPPQPFISTAAKITFYSLLSLPTIFTVLSLGGAWFFISALRHFKEALRVAYKVTAAGVVFLGLMHLQLPIIGYGSNYDTWWITDGAVGLLYTPAHILIFIGTVIFARTLGVRSRFSSWPVLASLSIAGILFVTLSPHTPALLSETFFDIATSTFPIAVIASVGAAINCYLIARKINEIYRKPLKWLGHANVLLAISVGHILILRIVFGYGNFWAQYGLLMLPYFMSSIALLRAGYLFKRTSSY